MTVNWQHTQQHPTETHSTPKWLLWAKAHQELVAVTGILVLLLGVGIPYYLHSQQQAEKDAQNMLNLAQYYLRMPIDPKNGFKTATDRDQQALQTFQRVTTDYPGTPTSKIARYYLAKTQYFLGQYTTAYTNFELASRDLKDSPLGAEAALGKVMCLEVQNQWPQAATLAESFLKEKPDSFLVPEVRLQLSEIYLKNQNKDKALEQLKLVAQTFPDSKWGKEAAHRLELLKS